MAEPHTPDPVDVYVGQMIRVRRKNLGISQTALGHAIGVSFQQIQKYERGSNRVSCSMLVRMSARLGCSAGDLLPATEGEKVDIGVELKLAGEQHGHELAVLFLAMPAQFRTSLVNIARSLSVPAASGGAHAA